MATATRVLREEHQTIREALNFAEGVSVNIDRGGRPSPEVLTQVMDFLRLYVDRCHHSKEEEILFPLLETKGMSMTNGPLGVMLMEHERARGLIQEMTEAAEACKADGEKASKQWARAAWDYSGLMQEHFGKEEEILFRMADNVLAPEEQDAIVIEFERLEAEKLGRGKHQEIESMMRNLIAERAN